VFAGSDRLRLGFELVAGFFPEQAAQYFSVADLQALLIGLFAMLLIGLGVFLCT
jgi:hypothetical protein